MSDEPEIPAAAVRRRVLSNAQVLAFIISQWLRRPGLLAATLVFLFIAVGLDLMLPKAAGALVDAVASNPSRPARAWQAWGLFVGVFLGYAVARNIELRFWNPFAAHNMEEMASARAAPIWESRELDRRFAGRTYLVVSRTFEVT